LNYARTEKETKGNNANPITRTPPNYSNQKPQEGTGGKGLHSRRIAVQGLKISSPNSNPRSGEEERKKEKRERRRDTKKLMVHKEGNKLRKEKIHKIPSRKN